MVINYGNLIFSVKVMNLSPRTIKMNTLSAFTVRKSCVYVCVWACVEVIPPLTLARITHQSIPYQIPNYAIIQAHVSATC